MSVTSMQHAFAQAVPADTPHIHLITRTISGLRVYFSNTSLDSRRFIFTLEGETLLLDEVPATGNRLAGQVVRTRGHSGEWQSERLRGNQLRMENLRIEPSWAAGKLAYVVPDIKELAVHPVRYTAWLRQQREKLKTELALKKLRQDENEQWQRDKANGFYEPATVTAETHPEVPPPPEPPPQPRPLPGPLPRLGPPGSTGGEIVAMDEYMKGVLRVIMQLEKISYHRLVRVRKENGDSHWAWRAPDIQLDE